ncbi:MAG: DUF1127 domain-containing protein [Paracoccaceae bacterium]
MAFIDRSSSEYGHIQRRRAGIARLLDLWRSRRALSRLDALALDDVGLSKEEAQIESNRPIWDVPATWKR